MPYTDEKRSARPFHRCKVHVPIYIVWVELRSQQVRTRGCITPAAGAGGHQDHGGPESGKEGDTHIHLDVESGTKLIKYYYPYHSGTQVDLIVQLPLR